MRLDELTVEVRDGDLNRVGQLSGVDLVGSQFVLRHNEIGTWTVVLHASSPMADLLRTPGFGLVVSTDNGVVLSGPTTGAQLAQSEDNPDGTWTITGVDDSVILDDRLAYPDPTVADVTAQDEAYDIREAAAETVLKEYLDANVVSGPTVRQVAGLTFAADLGRGPTVYGRARFDTLQSLFFGLAQTGGLGFEIKQVGSGLVFEVYEPVDRSDLIAFDIENGRLSSTDYSFQAPTLTRAIVGGAGEQEERLFFEGTLAQSTDAEVLWGRRIERFVDSRSTQESADFTQVATEALVDEGKTRVALTVTPTDRATMLFGRDWGLGDTIAVTVRDVTTTAVVYTVALSVQSDGVYLAAEVGRPTAVSYEQELQKVSLLQSKRLSEIERNTTGYGVVTQFAVVGGTDGTQPTFSGPVFTATYTRFGDMIHFAYSVDFNNITSFGTGQYFMTLPYDARRPYTFGGGALTDASGGNIYSIIGRVQAGSNVMTLWYIKSNGETEPFEATKPITLTTADSFDITGTYELEK